MRTTAERDETRDETLTVRVSRTERTLLERAAKLDGRPVSTFLRRAGRVAAREVVLREALASPVTAAHDGGNR